MSAVSGISEAWPSGRVLRLNLSAEANRRYAERLGVTTTPTFILFDTDGREKRRWVGVAPHPEQLGDVLATSPGEPGQAPGASRRAVDSPVGGLDGEG